MNHAWDWHSQCSDRELVAVFQGDKRGYAKEGTGSGFKVEIWAAWRLASLLLGRVATLREAKRVL